MQISNAKNILFGQATEWSRVMAEESERQSLLRYGMTLITIAYVLLFVLSFLFSVAISVFAPMSAMYIVTDVVIRYAISIASLYFVPAILASLAPSFGGENNPLNALKLFVFAATPAWLGSAVGIIPVLGWLAALAGAIFAIYLFWSHFQQAMSIPEDKKIGYVVVSIIVLALVHIVTYAIGSSIAAIVSPPAMLYHIGQY